LENKITIKIIFAKSIGGKAVLVDEIRVDFVKVLEKVAKTICLEIVGVGLKVHFLVSSTFVGLGEAKRIEIILCNRLAIIGGGSGLRGFGGVRGEGVKVEVAEIVALGLGVGAADEVAKLAERVVLVLLVSANFFLLATELVLADEFLEILVVDPHLELVDVVGGSGNSETVAFDEMGEIEVDVEDAESGERYSFSL
jgi:hypothetical protein